MQTLILLCMNISIKMEQIYKNLYKDEEGRYLFADDNDTRYIADQQSYLLVYILEMLIRINTKEEIPILNNEKGGTDGMPNKELQK